jgi:glycosyltransferase involved in cell wall biosynthesis
MIASPHFAVILCSHNGDRFIVEQLRSILGQPFAVSVYVHDFASHDGTRAALDAMRGETGGRITLTFHNRAPGAAASFLLALRGTLPLLPDNALILFADQDDVWRPEKLATIVREMELRALSPATPFLLFHDVAVVDADLAPLRSTYYTGNPFRVPRDLDRRRLMMANPAIGHTMLLSSPLARIVAGWPDGERYLMHDWLTILIASRIGTVVQIPEALSLYRQHDSNVLGAYRTRGGIGSLARLLTFVDRMTGQAMRFARTVNGLQCGNGAVRATYLDLACRRGYRIAALALAWAAAVHGPTWQRKAISLLLLARAVIGPKDSAKMGKQDREMRA